MSEYANLAKKIDALEFDTVFRIVDGDVVEVRAPKSLEEYAPSVYHDPSNDVTVDGHGEWVCYTGFTGQYSYNGAVMHPSEFVGAYIAKRLAEDAAEDDEYGVTRMFALVVVESLEKEDEDEPVGWAIAYRTA